MACPHRCDALAGSMISTIGYRRIRKTVNSAKDSELITFQRDPVHEVSMMQVLLHVSLVTAEMYLAYLATHRGFLPNQVIRPYLVVVFYIHADPSPTTPFLSRTLTSFWTETLNTARYMFIIFNFDCLNSSSRTPYTYKLSPRTGLELVKEISHNTVV